MAKELQQFQHLTKAYHLIFGGINIWPLAKQDILHRLSYKNTPDEDLRPWKTIIQSLFSPSFSHFPGNLICKTIKRPSFFMRIFRVICRKDITAQGALLAPNYASKIQHLSNTNPDGLILSEPNNYTDCLRDKAYNRLEDPFLEILGDHFRFIKIELSSGEFQYDQSSYQFPPIIIPLISFFNNFPKISQSVLASKRFKTLATQRITIPLKNLDINGFKYFESSLKKHRIPLPSQEWLLRRSITVLSYAQSIYEILCRIKPKALFLSCYYNEKGMGAALACRKFGIPCVEIQHGVQGDGNLFYCNWNDSEHTEYELLPNYFWTWDEPVISHIAHHKSYNYVVGGNLWTLLWKSPHFLKNIPDSHYIDRLISKKFPILITLNRMEPTLALPEFIFHTMANMGDKFFWLFRTHPLMPEQKGKLRKILKKFNIQNYEIELSSSQPLPLVISKAKLHLTGFSAVCLEAAEMGVKSLVTVDKAKNLFSKEIQKGIIIPALNSNKLNSTLMSIYNDSSTRTSTTRDFDFCLNQARKAIKTILSSQCNNSSPKQ